MEIKTITWQQFHSEFFDTKVVYPTYRLGQHFINTFIKDESDEIVEGLWGKDGLDAVAQCYEIIEKYQWDIQNLPVVDRDEE